MNRERALNTLLTTASILVVYKVGTSAFTRASREAILKRDGYRCRECGATDHLEASHLNHDRRNKRYNDPSNGRALCTEDHLKDHIQRHGHNGLTKEANTWAINKIRARIPRR